MNKTIQFHVSPDKRGTWHTKGMRILVKIVPTLREVKKEYGCQRTDAVAFFREFLYGFPEIAMIVFPRSRVGGSIVAHEAVHSANLFLQRQYGKNWPKSYRKYEEQFALAVGNIIHEITVGLFKYGVWK